MQADQQARKQSKQAKQASKQAILRVLWLRVGLFGHYAWPVWNYAWPVWPHVALSFGFGSMLSLSAW
eukprot:m.90482 g.90482  ORF g.90482 m.90482 type:complete len:67 (-) comp15009_c0_seq5:882-1082(-)